MSAPPVASILDMPLDDTQQRVIDLYRAWPSRKEFDPKQGSAVAFYGWLQASGNPVWSNGDFGEGSKFQTIAGWIAEWEGVAGEIERMHAQQIEHHRNEVMNGGRN